MKFRILCFLLLAFTFTIQAQQSSSVDAVIGLSVPYASFPGNSSEVLRELPGWRIGGNYHKALGQRFALRIGARVWVENSYINLSEVRWGTQHDGMGGFDPNAPWGEDKYDVRINDLWLEIPLTGRLYFGEGKWRGYAELGVAPTFFMTQRSVQTFEDGDRESYWSGTRSTEAGKVLLVGLGGGGVEFQAREQLAFFATILGRYVTNPIWKADLENFHNGNIGLEMGARFSLK